MQIRRQGYTAVLLLGLCLNMFVFTTACTNAGSSGNQAKDSVLVRTAIDSTIKKTDTAAIQPEPADTGKQYIYLTFDDGPQPPGTSNCYNTCKQLNAKASFFMVAAHANDAYRKREVDSIRNDYPMLLLCNHSSTHAFSDRYKYFYSHPHDALQDFLAAQQKLAIPYKIVRLPGNSAWVRQGELKSSKQTRAVSTLLDSSGYNVIGWDLEWAFKKDGSARPVQTTEAMLQSVINALTNRHCHTRNHVVILAHDRMFRHPEDVDSLYKFISALKSNPAYVLETIDHYPELKTK